MHFCHKKISGFTLIELLVVIAIICILASVVIFWVNPERAKARDIKRQSDLKQINIAMEMCYNNRNCGSGEGKYPVHSPPGVNVWEKIDSDGEPSLLIMPSDPKNSGAYQYKWTAGNERYYCIYVKLEAKDDTWFCASNKGLFKKTTIAFSSCASSDKPCDVDCCGIDVTN